MIQFDNDNMRPKCDKCNGSQKTDQADLMLHFTEEVNRENSQALF